MAGVAKKLVPNKKPLPDRVARAAETALAAQGYVSSIDVLVGIGWLDPLTLESWRRARVWNARELSGVNGDGKGASQTRGWQTEIISP